MRHETRPVTVRTRWLTIGEGGISKMSRGATITAAPITPPKTASASFANRLEAALKARGLTPQATSLLR